MTIRAEMNRLRRILCELAPESRPYRLPMAVGSDVDTVLTHLRAGSLDRALDAYTGPILPHSEAPAIVRERRRLHDEIRAAVLCGDASDLFRWGESPWGSDDAEVWQSVVDRTASGSARHTLARLRLSALDEELAT